MAFNNQALPLGLKIGDYVTLRHSKPIEGWLSAEGIISEDVILTKDEDYFENCLWEVHVQNQYSAVREYEEVLFSAMMEGQTLAEPHDGDAADKPAVNKPATSDEFINQLHRAATNEGRLNEKLMAMKVGKPVAFGDVIQLRHVKSKKFLTVNASVLAKHERENIRVSLEGYGDSFSWLVFMPRSKADREGQHIASSSECLLRVHERPSEFIHSAKKMLKSGGREINCSLESSCWTVSVYQHASDAVSKCILGGQMVTLQEPESSSYIAPEVSSGQASTSNKVSLLHTSLLSLDSPNCSVGTHLLWMLEKEKTAKGGAIATRGERVALRNLNTGLYLRMENGQLKAVQGREECSFFDVVSSQASDSRGLPEGTMVQLHSRGQWLHTPVITSRQSVVSSAVARSTGCPQMLAGNAARAQGGHMVRARSHTHRQSDIQSHRKCAAVPEHTLASYVCISNQLHQTLGVDLFLGVEAAKHLRAFEKSCRSKQIFGESLGYIETAVKNVFGVLETVFDFLTDDLLDAMHATSGPGSTAVSDSSNARSTIIRQTMMREQGVLGALLDLIELCGDRTFEQLPDNVRRQRERMKSMKAPGLRSLSRKGSFKSLLSQMSSIGGDTQSPLQNTRKVLLSSAASSVAMKSSARANHNFGRIRTFSFEQENASVLPSRPRNLTVETSSPYDRESCKEPDTFDEDEEGDIEEIEKNLRSLSQDISTACFKSLLAIIHDNHSNQMYIADKFPVLLNQVKDQELAVVCVQEMLRDNLQMLQTKVREREIGIFLQLLEESEMNVTLLNLLRSACSCPMGVDSTQRMVASALFVSVYSTRANGGKGTPLFPIESSDDCGETTSTATAAASAVPPVEPFSPESEKKIIRPSAMMTTPNAPFTNIRSSYVFSGASLSRSLLIKIEMSKNNKLKTIPWSTKTIYLPEVKNDDTVMGYSLVTDGLPRLILNWEVAQEDVLGMLHLFGFMKDMPYDCICTLTSFEKSKLTSPIEERREIVRKVNADVSRRPSSITVAGMRRTSTAIKRGTRNSINSKARLKWKGQKNNSRSTMERKLQVADYFCGQLYLLADLCLDRNYVAMNLVERQYPYEMLITMLKMPCSSSRFKAPVCRLIRCLYVDRDPQVEAKFPRLIRTSVSLEGGEENSFHDHHEGSAYAFGLLQQIISDYINDDLDTSQCDELSAEMIDLLLALIKFGFYNKVSQLEDIIVPLTQALDDHRKPNRRLFMGQGLQSFQSDTTTTAASKPMDVSPRNKSFLGHFWSNSDHKVVPESKDRDVSFVKKVFGIAAPSAFNSVAPEESSRSRKALSIKQRSTRLSRSSSARSGKNIRNLSRMETYESNVGGSLVNWQETALNLMESFRFICFILLLVIGTTVMTALDLANVFSGNKYTYLLTNVDLGVSIFFISELAFRMYCNFVVHSEIASFVTNPYRLLDVVVVVLDVAMLCYGSATVHAGFSAAKFAKTLRVLRILRLARLFRAARLLRRIAHKATVFEPYELPTRYNAMTEYEARTITGIMRVMSIVHDRLQDRKLGMLIQKFSLWFDDSIRNKAGNPREVYHQLCLANNLSTTFPHEFGDVLVDVLMYSEPVLVQEALRLLMVHVCHEGIFLSTARRVQIIYSSKLENIYKNLVEDLKNIKICAESFELWGDFDTDTDVEAAQRLLYTLKEIANYIKKKPEQKKFDCYSTHSSDEEIQQLLYNMDAMSVFMILQRALLDGAIGQMDPRISEIVCACNDVIVLFVDYNETNQNVAFHHIDWFIDRIDDGMYSSKVVRAIVSGNRSLIKQCPRSFVSSMIQKIISNGRKPEYLDLLIGLTDVSDSGDSGIMSLRSEISRYVTNSDRAQYLIDWCDSLDSPGYRERRDAMSAFVDSQYPLEDRDLPSDLQYHINLLTLLAGCKLGQKLQAVFAIEDIVSAILDPTTLYNVKRGLGILLMEIVETRVDGLEGSESLWLFFDSCGEFFEDARDTLPSYFTKEKSALRFQHAEWMQILLTLIVSFFESFDFMAFRDATIFENETSFQPTRRTEEDIQKLIARLMYAVKTMRSTHSSKLGPKLTNLYDGAIAILDYLVPDEDDENFGGETRGAEAVPLSPSKIRKFEAKKSVNVAADAIHEAFYRKQYFTFLSSISEQKQVYYASAMQIFEQLPSVKDNVEYDVRLEGLLMRVSSHIRNRIQRSSGAVNLERAAVSTALWLVETWTLLIYQDIGVEVEILADPTCSITIPESRYQAIMNANGITVMCLDLIAVGIDAELSVAALKLLVALLAKNGGNPEVQQTVFNYLSETDSTLFFEHIKDLIEQQMLWCQREAESNNDKNDDAERIEMPDTVIVLKALHSICEGGFLRNKDLIREQNGNSRWVNLLDYLGSYADLMSRLESPVSARIGIRVLHTMLGLMQGPCKGNQEHFVLHTNLLSALNRIVRSSQSLLHYSAQWEADLETLKEYSIDVLQASVEGQPHNSVVLERVQISMELNVLNVLIMPSDVDEFGNVAEITDLTPLQAKYLVFLKALNCSDADIPANAKTPLKQEVASIEVIWNQQVHKHYFHLPSIAEDISESSKRRLVEEVDLSSQELKLKDFMRIARDLHREAVHHQNLKSYGISRVWNLKRNLSYDVTRFDNQNHGSQYRKNLMLSK